MKILVVENSREGERPWWLTLLPPLPADTSVEIIHVLESGQSRWSIGRQLLRLLRRTRGADVVITMQDSHASFFLGLVNRFFPLRSYKHIVHEFMTREPSGSFGSKAKYSFLRLALSSVDAIHCSARSELSHYRGLLKLERTRFRYIPLSTNPAFSTWPAGPQFPVIISAGRTGRDYRTLVAAAEGLASRIQIVADPRNLSRLELPANVERFYNLPQSELVSLMSSARFVVIPLQNRRISVGQSVILIAMALGKAVITSRVPAVTDYVRDGQTGLLVPPEDPGALRQSMEYLLGEPDLAARLGAAGKKRVEALFLPSRCGGYVCASARSLMTKP